MAAEVFPSKLAAYRWVIDEGWQISQRGFYKHCSEGLIRQTNGKLTKAAVKKYAKTHLVLAETGQKMGESSDELGREKQRIDIELKREQKQMLELNRKTKEGKLIPRADVERELVARALVLDNGLRHLFQAHAAEWIVMVNGNQAKTAELIDALTNGLERQMNEYANLQEFTAALTGGE